MNSIDEIKKFPSKPSCSITYYVYNEDMISDAEELIADIHGKAYLANYVTVKAITNSLTKDHNLSYIDPLVFSYRQNGYN